MQARYCHSCKLTPAHLRCLLSVSNFFITWKVLFWVFCSIAVLIFFQNSNITFQKKNSNILMCFGHTRFRVDLFSNVIAPMEMWIYLITLSYLLSELLPNLFELLSCACLVFVTCTKQILLLFSSSLTLHLGVHKGMEWNWIECVKGKEKKEMEWNAIS